jgi:hypothetical protein
MDSPDIYGTEEELYRFSREDKTIEVPVKDWQEKYNTYYSELNEK